MVVLLGARLILWLKDPDPAHFNAYMWLVFLTLGGGGLLLSLGMLSSDAVGSSVAPWIFLLGSTFFAHRPFVRQKQPWPAAWRTAWCVAMASVIACGAYACVLEAGHCPDSTYSIEGHTALAKLLQAKSTIFHLLDGVTDAKVIGPSKSRGRGAEEDKRSRGIGSIEMEEIAA